DSGNGGHVHLRVDLPNHDAATHPLRQLFDVVAAHVDTERVHLDRTMFNASRIVKLPRTVAGKSDHPPDPPHRRAPLRTVPVLAAPADVTVLQAIVALRPADPPQQNGRSGPRGAFDLRAFLAAHDVTITREKPWQGLKGDGTFLEFAACLFDASHDR